MIAEKGISEVQLLSCSEVWFGHVILILAELPLNTASSPARQSAVHVVKQRLCLIPVHVSGLQGGNSGHWKVRRLRKCGSNVSVIICDSTLNASSKTCAVQFACDKKVRIWWQYGFCSSWIFAQQSETSKKVKILNWRESVMLLKINGNATYVMLPTIVPFLNYCYPYWAKSSSEDLLFLIGELLFCVEGSFCVTASKWIVKRQSCEAGLMRRIWVNLGWAHLYKPTFQTFIRTMSGAIYSECMCNMSHSHERNRDVKAFKTPHTSWHNYVHYYFFKIRKNLLVWFVNDRPLRLRWRQAPKLLLASSRTPGEYPRVNLSRL